MCSILLEFTYKYIGLFQEDEDKYLYARRTRLRISKINEPSVDLISGITTTYLVHT